MANPAKLLKPPPANLFTGSPKTPLLKTLTPFKRRAYLIVGAGWAGQTMALALIEKNPNLVLGFIDDNYPCPAIALTKGNATFSIPVLGPSSDLVAISQKHPKAEVILSITHAHKDTLLNQIVQCHEKGITLHEMPDLYAKVTGKIPVLHTSHHWIAPQLTAPKHDFYHFFQNTLNYILTLIGFVFFLAPLLPFLALAIKLDSKGGVFFKQIRVGYRGEHFTLLKFRTMINDADKQGATWTQKGDWRITRVGKFLRKFRLDELPQLLNILKGEMSLIGPRPEAVDLVEQFKKEIPFYEYRYLVRPGISGWAQVNYENTCSVDGALEKLQYDLYWIKNRSIWLDLKIIFRSVKVMLTGYGAV